MRSVLIFLAALFIHEAFHLLAGRVFSRDGFRVHFVTGGFRAVRRNTPPERRSQCVICACGQAGNLLSAAVFALLPGRYWIYSELVKANLLIGLFNLIPLYPMDGGNVLLVLLYSRLGSTRTIKIMRRIGCGVRIFLLMAGLALFFVYKNPSLFIAIALLPGIQSMKRSVNQLNLNALIRRKQRILKKKAYPIRHILVLKEVSLGEALLLLDYDQYHILHIANRDLNILHCITEKNFIDTMIREDPGKTLEEVFNLQE